MTVRNGVLALLAEQPMHAYQLKQQFEQRTGGTWPLNIGQVWTTVHRLVRDGLVEPLPAEEQPGTEHFRLTAEGRTEAAGWWTRPVERSAPARDELVIKVALAVTTPGVDVRDVIQRQRRESMRVLHEYTRLTSTTGADDLAWSLVLDNLVFAAEAEMRWLDHVEQRVSRAASEGRAPGTPGTAVPPVTTSAPSRSRAGRAR